MSHGNRRRHTHPAPRSQRNPAHQAAALGTSVSDIVGRHTPGQPIGDPRASRQPKFLWMPSKSYHDMLNEVTDAQNAFKSLPARLKGKFNNDPYQMMRWLENPQNRAEGLKLGLLQPTEEEAQELAREAAKARRTEQVGLIREAMRPDPEAQPEFGRKPPKKGGDDA